MHVQALRGHPRPTGKGVGVFSPLGCMATLSTRMTSSSDEEEEEWDLHAPCYRCLVCEETFEDLQELVHHLCVRGDAARCGPEATFRGGGEPAPGHRLTASSRFSRT